MARLLLKSPRMRAWALLPLLASSGCLFLDGLNHPPAVTLTADITTTVKGGMLTLRAYPSDPDNPGSLPVVFHVSDADGQPFDPQCDYQGTQSGATYYVSFFRVGIFRIEAVTTDPQGSPSSSSVMVTITDAPPVFDAKAKVVPTTTPDACGVNTAGDMVTLSLNVPATDADAGVRAGASGCPAAETLTYTWRITDQPSGTKPVLTLDDGSGCAKPTALAGPTATTTDATTQACLWTDPMIVGLSAMYSVALEVSDGTTTTVGPVGDVPVGPDQAPCITGTDPVAGSYVVDRTVMQEFQVDGVADHRDPFGSPNLTFAWSVWRGTDPVWRAVPSWTLSTYQLDVSAFGVGEDVRVRVEAIDRTGAHAPASICPVDNDDCLVMSCESSPVCHKWKTWDLELR